MNTLRHEFQTAWKNLFRNKRRSLITGLAILSGFVGLTLLAGYVARVERYLMVNAVYLNHNGHIQIYKKEGIDKYFSKPSRYLLDPKMVSEIKTSLTPFSNDIEFISPYLLTNGLLQIDEHSYPFQGKGVTPEADKFTRNHPLVNQWTQELLDNEPGTPLYKTAAIQNPMKITFKLSEKLQNRQDIQLHGLTVDNSYNAMDVTVATRYSTGLDLTEDTSAMSTLGVFQELMSTDGVSFISLFLKSDLKTRWIVSKLNADFEKKNLPFSAHSFFDERIALFYTGTTNFLYAMASFFFSLVSLVVILSVANAISMNIIERTKELGTMRALGFTPQDISRMIAYESFLLSVVATSVGFVLAQLISFIVNSLNIRFYAPGISGDMQFVLTPWPIICLILALPLIFFAVITAYIVTKRKLSGEVINLLSDPTS